MSSDYYVPQEPPDWVLEKIRREFKYRPNRKRGAVRRTSRSGVGYGYRDTSGYTRFTIGRRKEMYDVSAHHIAWYLYRHRYEWPTQSMDHINGDRLDNRISNLRYASQGQNVWNRKILRNNTSGHPGVSWRKNRGKWQVRIMKNYTQYYFGSFVDFEEAVAVARRERKRLFGRFSPNHGETETVNDISHREKRCTTPNTKGKKNGA